MLSDDPAFEQKAADVIGLYLNPQHADVSAADEKTARCSDRRQRRSSHASVVASQFVPFGDRQCEARPLTTNGLLAPPPTSDNDQDLLTAGAVQRRR